MFVTFEGGEGAGKSTQVRKLAAWCSTQGIPFLVTREPGGTPLGKHLRSLLLESQTAVDERAELLLYSADRAQHIGEVITPALKRGEVVLCDRFTDSTVAYQGYGRQLNLDWIEHLNTIATNGLSPDLTFWLNIPPEVGFARKNSQALDRLERSGIDFHRRIQAGFLALQKAYPTRIMAIDGTQAPEHVFSQILERFCTVYNSSLKA
jgi:dTMP kinase